MILKLIKNSRGFTLIELMIVVSIVGILASIAVPSYQTGLIKAREAVLRENLYAIRSAIDQHYADAGRYPDSLRELVEKKYLRDIPKDPIANSSDSWITVAPSAANEPGAQPALSPTGEVLPPPLGDVYDVHSSSPLIGTNGIPYNEW